MSCSVRGWRRKQKRKKPAKMTNLRRHVMANRTVFNHKIPPSIVHTKAVEMLEQHAEKKGNIIAFSEVRRILAWLYHLDRREAHKFIDDLAKTGLVIIVPYHGLRIVKEA